MSGPMSSPQLRTLLPSPLSRDNANQTPATGIPATSPSSLPPLQDDPLAAPYVEPDPESLLPPPNFSPLFTLIEDVGTSEHYHPSIHYLFSDDDPELLTSATMHALGVDPTALPPPPTAEDASPPMPDTGVRQPPTFLPARPGVSERYLIIDLDVTGQAVINAQSLNHEWQVTQTHVGAAPSWGEEGDDEPDGRGFMLRIEGIKSGKRGRRKEDTIGEARKAAGGDLVGGIGGVFERFEKGLGILDRVVGGGEV